MARLSAEDRKLFDRANKRIEAFTKLGLRNDIIEIIQNELTNVYLDASADMIDTSRVNYDKFSMNSAVMSGERLEDARNLANALLDAKSSTLRYYKEHEHEPEYRAMSFETVRSNPAYEVNNFQDYINFVDDMKHAKEMKSLLQNLGSKNIARLYAYGKTQRFSRNDIDKIMLSVKKKFLDKDDLYKYLRGKIDNERKKRDKKKNKGGNK